MLKNITDWTLYQHLVKYTDVDFDRQKMLEVAQTIPELWESLIYANTKLEEL